MSAAVTHLLRQMQDDPRLAYLIGPGSQSYALLTEEAAVAAGQSVEDFRAAYEPSLEYEEWPSAYDIRCRIEESLEKARK